MKVESEYLCPISPYAFSLYLVCECSIEQAMCDICLLGTDRYGCASATNYITSKDKLICMVLQGRPVLIPYQL
jgi:hypothetical protein